MVFRVAGCSGSLAHVRMTVQVLDMLLWFPIQKMIPGPHTGTTKASNPTVVVVVYYEAILKTMAS